MSNEKENIVDDVENLRAPEGGPPIVGTGTKFLKETAHEWADWLSQSLPHVPHKYKLIEDPNARQKSLYTLQFAVAMSAINTKMLNPNYAIMAGGLHEDSFPDTDPFDFNSATYFLPMMSLLGVAISSIFLGKLSDKLGRKRIIFGLAVISGIGSIVKFFTRETFWGFCITQLVFGFFLGNLPVAMAYIGDIFTSKKEKERQLSIIVANYVMGNSGGGIIAILMKDSGLFAALWVGSGLMFLSALSVSWWMIEPGDARISPIGKDATGDEDVIERPETIDNRTMWNVVAGALADNFGSTALFPLCLSPLALEAYTIQFTDAVPPEDPVLSVTGYQWLSVMVAFMVVPSTMITPFIFKKIGIASTCVIGNSFTAILTIALLFIATEGPASTAGFAGFVVVMYAGFPVTVWSQLTTGPMLDILAPVDKIGFVQGLNNSAMNFGMAIAPWLFGVLADATTTESAIWTGVGISFGAALINAPLMRFPGFGPEKPKPPLSRSILPGEEKEFLEKVLAGEFVATNELFLVNIGRINDGKPPVVPKVKPYEEDKDELDALLRHKETFRARVDLQSRVLASISKPDGDKDAQELCTFFNSVQAAGDSDVSKEATDDLGQWVGDYLADNGYNPHTNSLLLKQMVLTAFPSITREKELSPDNITEALVRSNQVMKEYLQYEEKSQYTWSNTLSTGSQGRFYS